MNKKVLIILSIMVEITLLLLFLHEKFISNYDEKDIGKGVDGTYLYGN